MTSLSVYHQSSADLPNKVLTHLEDIASTLAAVGVHFERWQAVAPLVPGCSDEQVLAAYRPQIETLMSERGYAAVDVLSVSDEHPDKAELRARCLGEQRQAEDQVRFFVVGSGLLSLHIDDYVYAVLCEKGDLVALPAGTRHWFDMGEHPHFVMIRLFSAADAWAGELTGDEIASRFPRLDD
ncbi:MAG: acireductone dioxygenase [Pseudomonas sp.]|nr:acireductone dioxygenase [Pseudomonas sp.]